jgi:four helix bundle protein
VQFAVKATAFRLRVTDSQEALAYPELMRTTGSFKELLVWQRSIELVTAIYTVSRQFPRDEIYALTNQIRRAAVSIPSNIAEGHGRRTAREFSMFLRNANGSLKEVETQLIVAGKLGYINSVTEQGIAKTIEEVGRMLHGLIQYQSARG